MIASHKSKKSKAEKFSSLMGYFVCKQKYKPFHEMSFTYARESCK